MRFIYESGLDIVSFQANGFYTNSGVVDANSIYLEIKDPKTGKDINSNECLMNADKALVWAVIQSNLSKVTKVSKLGIDYKPKEYFYRQKKGD